MWEVDTSTILFAIIGENLGVCESATFIGIIIVCWTIHIVYTGGFSDL